MQRATVCKMVHHILSDCCLSVSLSCPVCLSVALLYCGLCLLWPNGWIDQDSTWYEGGSRPMSRCVRRGPSPPRNGHISLPLFGPCLLWSRSPMWATAGLLYKILRLSRDMKENAKRKKFGRLGHSRSLAMSPFDTVHMTSNPPFTGTTPCLKKRPTFDLL